MGELKQRLRRFHDRYIELEHEPGLTHSQLFLSNYDLQPVEPARRTWGFWNFVGFWIADAFNVNSWMITSSMITSGLTWWQAWICVWVGYFLSALFIATSGLMGAKHHIGFPVICRASFGIYGSLWPVLNRAGMACIWYGVQSWIGGQCVTLMLTAIWPSYAHLPNSMPASSGTTTQGFLSFFLFWLFSLPAIWFPVHKIRHLFTVKAFVVPIAGFGFFGWAIARAGGLGPIVREKPALAGSELAWAMIGGIMSCISNFATLIVNDPDFTRFASSPRSAFTGQLIAIPLSFAITSFVGAIVSSSSTVIFGYTIWSPLDLLGAFLGLGAGQGAEVEVGSVHASGGARAAVFFISFAFALAQLGTNIAANSVSAGTDLTALMPRYLNIRRGGYICAIVGLVMHPWTLLSSSNNFTSYLSAYSVFLSSIAGVLFTDYFLLRRTALSIPSLYSSSLTSEYRYPGFGGVGWKAYTAYVAGVVVNVVGFAGAVGTDVPIGAVYVYRVNFFSGFIVASGVYWGLCRVWPSPGMVYYAGGVGAKVVDAEESSREEGSVQYEDEDEKKEPPAGPDSVVYPATEA